jgi:hypothetical protein
MNFDFRLPLLGFVVLFSISIISFGDLAHARTKNDPPAHVHASSRSAMTEVSKHYFVEFLARPTQAFGHSFVRFGVTDKAGHDSTTSTLGFYPVDKTGNAVFDTPGVISHRKRDLASQSTVKYRLLVSKSSYLKTLRTTQLMEKSWVRYDLIGHNCNHLVGQIARVLGLNDPGEYADTPENYVRALKGQNGGRERATWRRTTGT